MLKGKSFVKKTKRGGVVMVQQERYLRDDIPCGFTACSHCQQPSVLVSSSKQDDDGQHEVAEMTDGDHRPLPSSSSSSSSSSSTSKSLSGFSEGDIIIPDTNVVLHQVLFSSSLRVFFSEATIRRE